jgi:hypothetical protein
MSDSNGNIQVRYEMVQFLEKWTAVQDTRKMQTLLEPNVISADKHISINEDVLRCQAFQAVLQFEATQPERKLKYTKDPTAVYSMIEVERHELKLAPLCRVNNIQDVKPKGGGGIAIKFKDNASVFMTAQPLERNDKEPSSVVVPFWYVSVTDDETKANMRYATFKVIGCSLTILQNTKKLKVYDRLYVFKAPVDKKACLEGGTLVKPEELAVESEATPADPKASATPAAPKAPATKAKIPNMFLGVPRTPSKAVVPAKAAAKAVPAKAAANKAGPPPKKAKRT